MVTGTMPQATTLAKFLRSTPAEKADYDIWQEPPAPTWHKRIRIWLSRNSVLYQLVFHGPLAGRLQGALQIKGASSAMDGVTTLSMPDKNIIEVFHPLSMLRILDQNSPSVVEGMRITFSILNEMRDLCSAQGADFRVILIPTKEMVFADYLEHRKDLPLGKQIDELLWNERQAREKTIAFLTNADIPYVDTLPFLRRSNEGGLYVKSSSDMHPNRNGYRVIAGAVFESLK